PAIPCSTGPRPATPRQTSRRRSSGVRRRHPLPGDTGRPPHAPAGPAPSARRPRPWRSHAGRPAPPPPCSPDAPGPIPEADGRAAARRRRKRPGATRGRSRWPPMRELQAPARQGGRGRSVMSSCGFSVDHAVPAGRARRWTVMAHGMRGTRALRRIDTPAGEVLARTALHSPAAILRVPAATARCDATNRAATDRPLRLQAGICAGGGGRIPGASFQPCSEVDPQRGRIAAVVDVPRGYPVARAALLHDGPLLGIVEVVHLQAELDMVGDPVEDRTVELAEVVAEHRK